MPSSPPWLVTQCHYRWTFILGSGCQSQKTPTQTDAPYKEQLFVIKVCVESINSYLDFMNTGFVKNIIIAGFPGGGKTSVMMYIVIYAHS